MNDAHALTDLRAAAKTFFRHRGPRFLAVHAAACWWRRAKAGPPRLAELPVAAGVLAAWSLQEWVGHKHLLHLAPIDIAGRRFDLYTARRHREHHRQPRRIDLTLLPTGVLYLAAPVSRRLWDRLFADPRLARTAAATYATAALAYEWTHFLVHTSVKPRSAFYARIRRNHRLHHHLHEGHWYGFTMPWIDAVLGTDPDPKTVARSPTVRDLHGLADAA